MLSLHVIMTFPPQWERDQKSKRSHREFVCLGSCDPYANICSACAKVQFAEMCAVCTEGLSHTGTLRRTPKWILNHGVSTGKKADCAPRKFSFDCQIANFPQPFLLSKNQQRLWTADSTFSGTSGGAKTPQNICFCCWIKINSTELKAEQRKAFRIQWTFCLLHNPAQRSWSRAGGWIRELLLRAGKAQLSLRGLCLFSGRHPWRGRSGIQGGAGVVSVWAPVELMAMNPGKAHLDPSILQTTVRQSRVTSGSRAPVLGGLWGKKNTMWAFMPYFEFQRSISIYSSLYLSFASINIITHGVFKGKLERDALIFLLRSYLDLKDSLEIFRTSCSFWRDLNWPPTTPKEGSPKLCWCWSCHWS